MKKVTIHILYNNLRIHVFGIVFFSILSFDVFAQCTSTVNKFPYDENFETSNGDWVSGGTASDWEWGKPAKAVINTAGSGSKCWITGGLNKKAYNDAENAWIKSPCFNFSALKDPFITFKVFWETSWKDDGANLQYSTDNGITWQLLISPDESRNCLSEKWFNTGAVSNLFNQGWSGNTQSSRPGCLISNGSANWVTAKHNAPELAGKQNVLFRFVFASGIGCNDFDGFAVDDFSIGEAPFSIASFSYSCSSNLRLNFSSTASLCPTAYSWNFGDPSSGAENTSSDPNPTHAYTSGGKYLVNLTVTGPGNNTSTFTLPNLEIIDNIKASILIPVRCYDDTTGSLTVTYTGDSSAISYSWDSDPVQTTRTAVHLGAGDYNVTILNSEGCPASANISLGEPPPLLYTTTLVKPACTASNGSISLAVSGGVAPYSYSWSPPVSTTSSATKLPSGTYKITVTDNNQCYKVINVDLPGEGDLAAAIATTKDVSCFAGNNGAATVSASGGAAPYDYSWPSVTSNKSSMINLTAGTYPAVITDAIGCKAYASAVIHEPSALTSTIKIQNTFCGKSNGNATVTANGGTAPYQYIWTHDNNTNAVAYNLGAGQYIVSIKDKNGCALNDTAIIESSSAIQLQLSHNNILCAGEKTGSAEAIATGGIEPYNFHWTNGISNFNSNNLTGINAGTYKLSLQDAVGCSVDTSITITEPEILKVDFVTKPSYCDFSNGSANANVTGGTMPYNFLWSPNNNRTAILNNVLPGNYRLTVTDKNNCSVSLLTTILNNKPTPVFIGNDTTICPGNVIKLVPGNYTKYQWQDNSTNAVYTVTNAGLYTVKVTDDFGCILKDSIKITGDCGYIFFPTAITPNNDMRNDFFGPVGILTTVKDYKLVVYNRLGQLVFKSTDPFKKWDGKSQNNNTIPGTYVWIASYSNKGILNIVQKGTVTVIN